MHHQLDIVGAAQMRHELDNAIEGARGFRTTKSERQNTEAHDNNSSQARTTDDVITCLMSRCSASCMRRMASNSGGGAGGAQTRCGHCHGHHCQSIDGPKMPPLCVWQAPASPIAPQSP